MAEQKQHPRLLVERYLGLVDELEGAEHVEVRAANTALVLRSRLEVTRRELAKHVGRNKPRRMYHFDNRVVMVEWQGADERATIAVYPLE